MQVQQRSSMQSMLTTLQWSFWRNLKNGQGCPTSLVNLVSITNGIYFGKMGQRMKVTELMQSEQTIKKSKSQILTISNSVDNNRRHYSIIQ